MRIVQSVKSMKSKKLLGTLPSKALKSDIEYVSFSNKFSVYLNDVLFSKSERGNFTFISGDAGSGKSTVVCNEFYYPLTKDSDVSIWFDFLPNTHIHNHFFVENLVEKIQEKTRELALPAKTKRRVLRKSDEILAQLSYEKNGRIFDTELNGLFIELLEKLDGLRITMFFEDIHLAHKNFSDFLAALARRADNLHFNVICTTRRTKRSHALDVGGQQKWFNLSQLTSSNMTKYLRSIGLEKGRDLVQLSRGNPFYLKEIYFLEKQKKLAKETPEKNSDVVHYRIPEGPQSILLSRILFLDNHLRTILEILSVMGFEASLEDFVEFLQLKEIAFTLDDFTYLCENGLLSIRDNKVKFGHHLIYESLSTALLETYKTEYHADLYKYYRGKRKQNRDKYMALLEYHARNAKLYAYASFHSAQLANYFFDRGQYNLAAKYYDSLLETLPVCSSAKKFEKRMFDTNIKLHHALLISGDCERSDKVALNLVGGTEKLNDKELLDLYSVLTTSFWTAGKFDRALHYAKETLKIAEEQGERSKHITALVRAGSISLELGKFQETLDFHEAAKAMIKENESFEKFGLFVQALPNIESIQSMCWAELGNVDKAKCAVEKSLKLLGSTNDDFTKIFIIGHISYTLCVLGEFEKAYGYLKMACSISENNNMKLLFPLCFAIMGYCELYMGDTVAGYGNIKKALDQMQLSGQVSDKWLINTILLESRLICYDLEEFRSLVKSCIKEAEEYNQAASLGWIYFLEAVYYAFYTSNFTGYVGALAKSNMIAVQLNMDCLSENIQYLMLIGKGGLLALNNITVSDSSFFNKAEFYEQHSQQATPLFFHKENGTSS